MTRLDRVEQSLFVNDPTASTINQSYTLLHSGNTAGVDQPFGLGSHRRMNRQEVALANQFVDIAIQLNSFRTGTLFGQERVITQDLHFERDAPAGDC